MRILFLSVIIILLNGKMSGQYEDKPSLIVQVVVDQLRYDYISKYWSHYSDDGFKKLIKEGYFNANAHYSQVPTYTGVGHAIIATGTTPSIHGIAGNNWYDREQKKLVYCVEDETVETVGSFSNEGKFSPRNLISNTFADQLKILHPQSKTIGISLKDRGAILMAGHLADAAYWFDGSEGKFITSNYYMDELPEWVVQFNEENPPQKYLNTIWELSRNAEDYIFSTEDNMPFEGKLDGMVDPVFPYNLASLYESFGPGLIRTTPFGNTYTFDFAKETIVREDLGKDAFTDLISISLSSPDYLGHVFGPHSMEIEDHYIRLDEDFANFILFLESWVGKENLLLFISSDHGVADIPAYVKGNTSYFPDRFLRDTLKRFSIENFGEDLIEFVFNDQIYIDRSKVKGLKIPFGELKQTIMEWLVGQEGIAGAGDPSFGHCIADRSICERMQNGYHPKRSGDVFYVKSPGWIDQYNLRGGTTHGSPFPYDTHVPVIWYGFKTQSGISHERVAIKDIAPTLSSLLGINYPNGATGLPMKEYLDTIFKK
ncbi:MAG TPA: alkaline phosphatase family protein [Saprospiraceae bacterium]|nr:alkaline phosphatase family protein [Saprospiraceae bacterium]